MTRLFPEWHQRIDYWDVHDQDFATPEEALPQIRAKVEALIDKLAAELPVPGTTKPS